MEGLIKLLNNEGYSILLIDEGYYLTDEFIPADKNIPYHTLKGKNITDILINNINLGYNYPVIQGQIDKEETLNIRFSGDFNWKWYTNS